MLNFFLGKAKGPNICADLAFVVATLAKIHRKLRQPVVTSQFDNFFQSRNLDAEPVLQSFPWDFFREALNRNRQEERNYYRYRWREL